MANGNGNGNKKKTTKLLNFFFSLLAQCSQCSMIELNAFKSPCGKAVIGHFSQQKKGKKSLGEGVSSVVFRYIPLATPSNRVIDLLSSPRGFDRHRIKMCGTSTQPHFP